MSPSRLRVRWAGVSLRSRLVAIIAVLLGAGLILAGAAAATLLRSTLLDQVDAKLQSEAVDQTDISRRSDSSSNSYAPSDYFVRQQVAGVESTYQSPAAAEHYGQPEIPDLTADEAAAIAGVPFTVPSTTGGSSWRVVAFPGRTPLGQLGSVAVALPLMDVDRTVEKMVLTLVLSGLGIVLLGVVAGGWAVQRSLRPLQEIETTAAAIADGDLSQRVPPAPESTEVGRLSAALNGMLTQIEQAFDARTASEERMRRFVADASHELRTPLATIRGYAELYRMGALTERDQVDDTMRRVEQSATRMGALVQDLLALARLDERRPMSAVPVDLTVLAGDALSDLHALDPGRSARLEPLGAGGAIGPCVVTGDEARLRQVVANLVGNVVQHTPAGSPVELAVGVRDGAGVLEVRDHGPGIDPVHAARVFERFYRVDASRTRESGGAGLGMAIVAAIVDAHGGAVDLRATVGGGTTVSVRIPLGGAASVSSESVTDRPVHSPDIS
ncbi:sensor histidine kinase [Cellulomonas soli]|uniref:histidine kinase n=1 Tax=Cellulomonas soli TaxID=931535 RepID=A0A512PER5_9CELL|nr:HAMP domain-containing sensor histidine kinase [Cellulomonas soli]NYI59508.1 two-component system OmpR family sensor kinase [Cellulomonas soli]GEP69700.1 two-component sensor histidine kinase [Cellulomonas soli]